MKGGRKGRRKRFPRWNKGGPTWERGSVSGRKSALTSYGVIKRKKRGIFCAPSHEIRRSGAEDQENTKVIYQVRASGAGTAPPGKCPDREETSHKIGPFERPPAIRRKFRVIDQVADRPSRRRSQKDRFL